MSYSAEINRNNPTCFLFLVDQSRTMLDPFGATPDITKSQGVADAINNLIRTIVLRSSRGQEGIRDYFYLGVIGYGATVESGLGGKLAGQGLVPISEIGKKPLRVDRRTKKVSDGAGGILEETVKFPIWLEPTGNGKTPMCKALELAREVIVAFLSAFPDCFPPTVINITDGQSTDGDPRANAEKLRDVGSTDGKTLLFNAHITSDTGAKPILYPNDKSQITDEHARLLFDMSSTLPSLMRETAPASLEIKDGARGFLYNTDLVSVIELLDIGTRRDRNMQ